jgi:hypothetical protein
VFRKPADVTLHSASAYNKLVMMLREIMVTQCANRSRAAVVAGRTNSADKKFSVVGCRDLHKEFLLGRAYIVFGPIFIGGWGVLDVMTGLRERISVRLKTLYDMLCMPITLLHL